MFEEEECLVGLVRYYYYYLIKVRIILSLGLLHVDGAGSGDKAGQMLLEKL